MTPEELRAKNPEIALFEIDSPEFTAYGRRVPGIDPAEILRAADAVERPREGSAYVASLAAFEALPVAGEIAGRVFGTLPMQTGYCHGHNGFLNALEWHMCSEVNIAVTDLVLLLGRRQDLAGGQIDASALKAFYLRRGDVVEIYATSLHFCPCEVDAAGFGCVVCLPTGTNLPLEGPADDPLLFRRNKWLIAHMENAALIARGAVPGITGENIRIAI